MTPETHQDSANRSQDRKLFSPYSSIELEIFLRPQLSPSGGL